MKQDKKDIEKALNDLYVAYGSTKVMSYDDFIVYTKIPIGMNNVVRKELEQKIKELNLPLIVEPLSTHGVFQDTVVVRGIE